ncbi:M14 family metallopeptidase [Pararhodobacter sp.]|uniref:M14 family metallopeptidase n=1 Tax=Pararhodobacter sp. TaxID=2127056 RepID=UPI002FE2DBEB
MQIDAALPSGRIRVLDATDSGGIRLSLPADEGTPFLCWYCFEATGPANLFRRFVIENASDSLKGRLPNRDGDSHQWNGAGPVASYDGIDWFRLDHAFDGRAFSFWHTPRQERVFYAKFPPVWPAHEAAQRDRLASLPGARHDVLGQSGQGRTIDRFRLGEGPLQFWVIARQHPSETQGAYFLDGLAERLALPDADSRALLAAATLHIVPNVNPDGWAAGQTRATPAGVNLNREWNSAAPAAEVAAVRAAMEASGVDVCLDCHADNELPFLFIWPSENVPSWTADRRRPFDLFEATWAAANPDLIPGRAYPGGCPAQADLSMGWNWIGERFPQALSILLEQTFKDVSERPDPVTGWSIPRARALGRSVIAPLLAEARRRVTA